MMRRIALFVAALAAVLFVGSSAAHAMQLGGIGSSTTQTSVSTCAYENLGWILCPVINATATAGDFAFSFMAQSFTQLEVGLVDNDSGARQAGAIIRNFANILFVFAFLVIVYSLVTGNGIGNYNLKRLVPRFIVAVIFVQASYFICQLMVDASNILGYGIRDILVTRVADNIGPSAMPLATELGQDITPLSNIASSVTSSTDIAWQLLAPLGAIVMAATIICSILIVVLIIRKVLVVALMMIAPLAFVAYLLPNTSDYFSRWLKIFAHTLLLFPVVSLLLGTGQIVSASILRLGGSAYEVENDKITIGNQLEQSATLYLVAAGAAVLPLVGTWYAFKAVTNSIDAAGARVSRDGLRRSSKERDEKAKRREQTNMDMNKKSMMLRGVNRLQQISNAEGGGSVFGRSYRGRNKHQPKSPEQAKFDTQVQQRLSELRANAQNSEQTPQELYSQALQRYQEKLGEPVGDGGLNINSYEGIDLKASEAFLLESLGKGNSSAALGAVVAPQSSDKDDPEKKSAGISSLNRDGKSSGGGDKSSSDAPDGYRQPSTGGAAAATVFGGGAGQQYQGNFASQSQSGAGGSAGGATIIVQGGSPGESGAGLPGGMANGTGFAAHRPTQNSNEQLAKARAAKYVAEAQDSLDDSTELLDIPKSDTQPNDDIPKV